MPTLAQRSFAGGEISPTLFARVDVVKYATGLRTCRNFLVARHGGIFNRPGTTFVAEVKDSTKTVRLIPFVFNPAQTYVLEFGNLYMRVHRNGGQILESAKTITGITQASPAVVTSAGHGFSNGDEVFVNGVAGMTEVNNRNFKVANVTANTFELQYMDGSTDVDSTGFGAYSSGGTAAKVFEISTPYPEADLQEIQFVQSADVMTLVHPNHAPRELSRITDTNWTLATITFEPSIARPTGASGAAGGAGTDTFRYKITANKVLIFEESLPATQAAKAITNITQANPAVVTSAGHGYSNGDEVLITGVSGMTEVNSRVFVVAGATANTFELRDTDSTGFTAYSSGGSAFRTSVVIAAAATPTSAAPHVLSWTDVADAVDYNVYKDQNGVFGFIGTSPTSTFSDTGITPDTSDTPPFFNNPFLLSGDFPSTVSYFQQRRIFANTDNEPEKVFASRTGESNNLTFRQPLQDDDAAIFTIIGRQVNEIRHLVDVGALVVLTTGGEWTIEGNVSGILTPTEINPRQRSYNGSSELAPLVIGGNALYVQARGAIVRDLFFDASFESFRGNDLSIFASHLFEGFTLRDWAFQQIPHSIVWAARSDGTLLGMTYVPEQRIFGWHRHDFQEEDVEQVAVVPEGQEDFLYVIVERNVTGLSALGGSTRRYLERLSTRVVSDIEDAIFMDSALTFDGRNTDTGHTMTLSGGPPWTANDVLTLTSSKSFFLSSDVGNEIHLTGSDGTLIRFEITAFTSATVVSGRPNKDVPASLQNTATSTWTRAVDQVTGLWHLEGKEVSVLGDGFVVANPNNAAYDKISVSSGVATLDRPYGVVHVGLPYVSDMQTLDIDLPTGESIADKAKHISHVTAFVESSRGIFVGSSEPATDSELGPRLTEIKLRDTESTDDPVDLETGPVEVNIRPEWNDNGRIFVRQTDPIPLSVLAVMPAGFIPVGGQR